VVCQSGLYIVEITPYNREGASPLLMKVLNVVLDELSPSPTTHEAKNHPLPRARFERRFVMKLNLTS